MNLYVKAANRTAIILIINILIGLGLVTLSGNNNAMSYWLLLMLTVFVYTDSFYHVLAKFTLDEFKKQLDKGKENNEDSKSE